MRPARCPTCRPTPRRRGPRRGRSASGADSVSFHSLAGCSTSSSASSATIPCCCPATARATTSWVWVPRVLTASCRAVHHAAGSCSLRGGVVAGWRAEAAATSAPSSSRRRTTVVDCVEVSMPAMRLIAAFLPTLGARHERHEPGPGESLRPRGTMSMTAGFGPPPRAGARAAQGNGLQSRTVAGSNPARRSLTCGLALG